MNTGAPTSPPMNIMNGALNVPAEGLERINSFITNTASKLTNTGKNTIINTGNVIKNALPASVANSIDDSLNAVPNTESLWISLPMIVSIGAIIVVFILFVVFRDQIETTLMHMWSKFRELVGLSKATSHAPSEEAVVGGASASEEGAGGEILQKVLPAKKEVFNVAPNKYTYSDAEPLCKALGAELATYDQVREAWKQGADWCNYGWVKGQAAVYPTQNSTYERLQNEGSEEQRQACGQVGVNGGYFDNASLRFGVNCYGTKPAETNTDREYVMDGGSQPLTQGQLEFNKKETQFRAQAGEIPLTPFRPGAWSQ